MQGNLVLKLGFTPSHLQLSLRQRFLPLCAQQTCAVHKQSFYDKLNVPPKPKKPMTPFFLFMAQVRPTLTKEYPEKKITELVKIAAERWTNVDSKLKEKLTQQYKDEIINYNKTKFEYENKLSPEDKEKIKRAELHSLDIKEQRRTKKKSRELGKPKRPLTAFMKYLTSRVYDRTKYPEHKEWVRAVSQEWKTLNPQAKAKLEAESKLDFQSWNHKLNEWEEKMIKEGNIDVIRSSSLPTLSKTKLKK
uniref:HMG box domain-containing protein n=1 Tax=Graphocephala atropunctata TaxID=36148 RepID=A0A1B6KJS9_9HEMI